MTRSNRNFPSCTIPFLPLICGVFVVLVAFIILAKLCPLDLSVPEVRDCCFLSRSAPLHYAAATFLALLMIQVAVVAFSFYTLRTLPKCAATKCPAGGGQVNGNFFLGMWLVIYVMAHATYRGLRACVGDSVHPVMTVGEEFLKIALEGQEDPTALWQYFKFAMCAIEFMTFVSIAGLITTVCALVCLVRNASEPPDGAASGYLKREYKIAHAIRLLTYQIVAGGLMLAANVWNHHTWLMMPLWRSRDHATGHLRDSIESLVAFHSTMHVLLLLAVALPAFLIVRESAFQYARKREPLRHHRSLHEWMNRRGLRFYRTGLVSSAISILLPALVSEALGLF